MALNSLQDLFIEQLKDLYSAETQIIAALPKMAAAASSPELKQGFETHLQETQVQKQRLEQILSALGEDGGGHECAATKGLVEEGQDVIDEDGDPDVKDAALIASAQRVEHYEMAGYGTARTFARHLNNEEAVNLLQATLDEEQATDEKLTRLAEGTTFGEGGINSKAENAG